MMKFAEQAAAAAPDTGPRTQSSALVERLRTDIVAGQLAPGARLKLPELAGRYDSGINPLREALARLSASGLVVLEDQKGFRVAPVSRADLLDLTRARIEIDCLALRLSIEQGDVEWEARLIAAHHRMSRMKLTVPGGTRRLSEPWETIHQDFHQALISGSGSRWLVQFHGMLAEQSARYRRLSFSFADGKRDIAGEHADILAAVLARDANRACALVREHFTRTSDLVLSETAPAKAAKARR